MCASTFEIRHDTVCKLCKSTNLARVLELEPTPAEDQFVTKDECSKEQKCYPLDLALCQDCGYVFLPYILNPEISYPNYTYVSKVTVGLSNHYQDYADALLQRFSISDDALIVDLGSNDGTMLEAFQRRGRKVLGVEPGTAVAKIAQEAGVPTLNSFFTDATVKEISLKFGQPELVTANYMYANIDDLKTFTDDVEKLLPKHGLFSVQTGYHPDQFKILMFDYIYHEHFSYFTVDVLRRLFSNCGLELIFVEKTQAKGGSVRVVAQKKGGPRKVDSSVEVILAEEDASGVSTVQWFQEFATQLSARRSEVRALLTSLKQDGKVIIGYGASHSTTTLLYHFGLDEFIDTIVDDNPIKQGRFSPGKHLPVFSSQKIGELKPDYIFVLGWQHRGPIMKRNENFIRGGGSFIVPFPTLKIISDVSQIA